MDRLILLFGVGTVAIAAGVMAQVKPHMPADVGPGRVAWFDISTTDLARGKEFYGTMFDWTFTAVTGTDQAVEINSRGTAIGTIRGADGAISGFNGVVYIQVDDVRSASEKATTLGGTVVKGFPFNLPNGTGAISLILDPSGHPLGLYSRALMPTKTPSHRGLGAPVASAGRGLAGLAPERARARSAGAARWLSAEAARASR